MKKKCRTCNKEWIVSKKREGPYECPICEQKRIKEKQRKRPYGTANSNKAKTKKQLSAL